jgi:hypothetical protein
MMLEDAERRLLGTANMGQDSTGCINKSGSHQSLNKVSL